MFKLLFIFIAFFARPAISEGRTHTLTFMNITVDGQAVSGFIQLLIYSNAEVGIRVLASKNNFQEFDRIGSFTKQIFNDTEDYVTNPVNIESGDTSVNEIGVSIYSGGPVSIIGVKSDRGSTDAFLALPVVTGNKEFIVALWGNTATFQGSIQVIGTVNGTCVEIYKIFHGNKYLLVYSASLDEFQVLRYFQQLELNQNKSVGPNYEDLTGFYVNSSRSIQVIAGHECAQVPQGVKYCDHMSEQIPAMNQLGRRHVVPPIAGRLLDAGFVIRVIAAQKDSSTDVQVVSYGQKKIQFGEFYEVDITSNLQPVLVTCDTNCLVMQYNKGFRAKGNNDNPTDPFMMAVTASDRFTNVSSFGTPSYCNKNTERVPFDNYVTIVTFGSYQDYIYLNGTKLLDLVKPRSWQSFLEFSVISFNIPHAFHLLTSTKGSFAAYIYGHSILYESPSAYGFAANYNITGEQLSDGWEKSQPLLNNYLLNNDSTDYCNTNSTQIGQDILSKTYASHPISLVADFEPVDLTETCRLDLEAKIKNGLLNFREKINRWICLTLNCSYLQGFGVAINNFSVSFVTNNQGKYSAIQLDVDIVASYETLAFNFAKCRLEITNDLSYFVNWSGMSDIFTAGPNSKCPSALTFKSNRFNFNPEAVCRKF